MRSLHLLSALCLLPLSGCGDEGDNTLFVACLRNTACGVFAYPNLSNCVDNYRNNNARDGVVPVADGIFKCVAAARTCAAVQTCHGQGAACDASYTASCAGGKASFCDLISHLAYTHDCAGAGLTCKVDSSNKFAANCQGPRTSATLATAPSCDGELCEETSQSCDGNVYDSCSGSKVKSCINKRWVLFDCKALGLGDCYTSSSTTPPTSSCGLPL